MFELGGGAYTPDSMVQAAIDRIREKIKKYERANHRAIFSGGVRSALFFLR